MHTKYLVTFGLPGEKYPEGYLEVMANNKSYATLKAKRAFSRQYPEKNINDFEFIAYG